MDSNTLAIFSNWLDAHPPLDELDVRSLVAYGQEYVALHVWRKDITLEQYQALATCCWNGLAQDKGTPHVVGRFWLSDKMLVGVTVFEALGTRGDYIDPDGVAHAVHT